MTLQILGPQRDEIVHLVVGLVEFKRLGLFMPEPTPQVTIKGLALGLKYVFYIHHFTAVQLCKTIEEFVRSLPFFYNLLFFFVIIIKTRQ